MNGAIARIILRYVVSAAVVTGLISKAFGDQISGDSDLVIIVTHLLPIFSSWVFIAGSAFVGFLVERYYKMAKKYGWPT